LCITGSRKAGFFSLRLHYITWEVKVTETVQISTLALGTVTQQAEGLYGAFAGLLAVVAGVGLGGYVWRRLSSAAKSV
jgi:hypothetical protein